MKNIGKIISVGFLFLFLIGSINPVFGEESEEDNIYLEFSFTSPFFEKTNIKDKIYDVVKINDLPNTNDLGIPRLPVKSVRILLPQGRDIKDIKVITTEEENFGMDFNIVAGGKLVPLVMVNKIINNKEFQSNTIIKKFETPIYENKGVYCCRGFNILHINLYPVQYFTENGELSFFKDMKIIVETKESTVNEAFRGREIDYLTVQNIVDNPEYAQTYKKSSTETYNFQEQYDYVVITNEDLKFSNGDYTFQDLLDLKESNGLTTKIVTVEDIVTNPDYEVFGTWGDANEDNPFYESDITGNLEYFDDTAARIRNFIRFAYSEWGTSYILLGGDADVIIPDENIIPARGLFANESGLPLNGLLDEEEDDIASDVYYACLNGNFNYDCDEHFGECADRNDAEEIDEADLYSEVSVGRVCVDSEQELSNFIMKTIQYETGGGDYYSKILYIGEYLGENFYSPWGGDYKDIMESYIPSQYSLEKLYDRDDPYNYWDPYELINRLGSDPVQFINHMGHGNLYYILKMSGNDIETLTNEKHFFIYSQACYTGSFDNKLPWSGYIELDCIAELITGGLEYGAYACILNARFGLGSEDTIDSPSGALDESFIKAIFSENIKELGPANHYSKEDNIWRIDENGIRWCFYQTNLFGDPHLRIKGPNQPPEKPVIDGPNKVKVGETHDYIIYSIDPDNDDLMYHIDIDDGTGGEWFGPYPSGEELIKTISFDKKGYVTISVKARDTEGAVSETATLRIQVPRNRAFFNLDIQHIFEVFSRLKNIFYSNNLF